MKPTSKVVVVLKNGQQFEYGQLQNIRDFRLGDFWLYCGQNDIVSNPPRIDPKARNNEFELRDVQQIVITPQA